MTKVLPQGKLKDFLKDTMDKYSLVAPVREDGVVVLKPTADPEAVVTDYLNTVTSPKDFFFPQTERMFRFQKTEGKIRVEETTWQGKRVIFGVRPCDLGSLELIDRVFQEGEYEETYYLARRENTTVVGLACSSPGPTCFCTTFGITPGSPEGADLMLYPDGEGFVVEVLTEKGEALAQQTETLLEDQDVDLAEVKGRFEGLKVPLGDHLSVDGVAAKLDGMFEHPVWAELSPRCLGCGICTYLCPTCHCFGMTDEVRGDQGVRLRCWDSCQFSDFTRMAGGHNPRPTKKERVRQRFMHKLNYYVHRFGRYLCTGCGRCLEKCPVGLTMVHVIEKVNDSGTREVAVNE